MPYALQAVFFRCFRTHRTLLQSPYTSPEWLLAIYIPPISLARLPFLHGRSCISGLDTFFRMALFVSVYVYTSLCEFFWIAFLLPFVLGFCLSLFLFLFKYSFQHLLSLVDLFFGLVALFIHSFFLINFNFFIFNNLKNFLF